MGSGAASSKRRGPAFASDTARAWCYGPPVATPDFPPRSPRRDVGGRSFVPGFRWLAWTEALKRRKRRHGRDGDQGGAPAAPDRPMNLTGGGAAELDFED
ncbi:MAG: hypothetical protein QOJ94_2621 [Sphingomonadales bacterium]|jgi:hypothetical protein|nr:hypothetical protein [Sphingomonadales bacterium]